MIVKYPEEAKRLPEKLEEPFRLRGPKLASIRLKYDDIEECAKCFGRVISRV